jgi:hypothetical protein
MRLNKYSTLVSRICHSPGMPVCQDEDPLPETDFDFCEPETHLSEIQRVFLALPESEGFVDWSDRVEWLGRLTQSGTGVNAIRTLTCIGDKPAPNSVKKAISLNRTKITLKTHTLFITIDEVSDLNHVFVQKLKNGKKFRMWYESAGELLFGGNDGIMVTVYGDMVLLRGKGEVITYELQVVWESLRTEDRIQSPIFGLGPADAMCSTLGELTSSSVTDNSMVVSWDPVPAASYQWAMNTTGDVPDTWTNIPPTLTEIAITGLAEETEYFIFVRAVCYNGSIGAWEGTRVTTAAAAGGLVMPVTDFILALASSYGIVGSAVDAWADYSGYGNDFSDKHIAGNINPAVVPGIFGSQPGIYFAGNSQLRSNIQLNGLGSTQAIHIFLVARMKISDIGGGGAGVINEYGEDFVASSAADSGLLILDTNSGGVLGLRTAAYSDGVNAAYTAQAIATDDVPVVIEIVMDYSNPTNTTATTIYYHDGSHDTVVSPEHITGTWHSHHMYMGARYDNTLSFKGYIGCEYIYPRKLSPSEVHDTVAALISRYSI